MTETKTCTKCHETKPLTEYTRTNGAKSGRRSYCRQCQAKQRKDYRERNREKLRADTRRRNPTYQGRYKGRYKGRYQATYNRCRDAWYAATPGAKLAHKALGEAVRKGVLPPIKTRQCADCGKPAAHYHHHLGYEEAHWLDVVPLCVLCHHSVHEKKH